MKKFTQVMKEWGAPALALVLPALASAQMGSSPINAPTNINTISQVAGKSGIICTLINWVFWLLIVLAIVFVLVAAFKYFTAGGDPEKVKAAGSTLLYAAIAVVVGLIAKGLPMIISTFIGGGLSGVGC